MAFRSSRQDVSELLARKSITIIPKDQQSLHEQSTSWVADTASQSSDWVPVPNHVLQTTRDAFLRTKKKRDSELDSTSVARTSSRRVCISEQGSPSSSNHPHSHEQFVPPTDAPRDAFGTAQDQPFQSSIVSETPRRLPPMGPPPKPGLTGSAVEHPTSGQNSGLTASDIIETTPISGPSGGPMRPALDFDFQSSGPEDDLEMQIPQAQVSQEHSAQLQTNYNPSAPASSRLTGSSVRNTPPCAQPSQSSISSTQPEARQPSPKLPASTKILHPKQRLRPGLFDFPELDKVEDLSGVSQRKAPALPYPPVNGLTSSNSMESSPPSDSEVIPPIPVFRKGVYAASGRRERKAPQQVKYYREEPAEREDAPGEQSQRPPDSTLVPVPPSSISSTSHVPIPPASIQGEAAEEDASVPNVDSSIVPATHEPISHFRHNVRGSDTSFHTPPIHNETFQTHSTEVIARNPSIASDEPVRVQHEQTPRAPPSITGIRQDLMPYALFTATYPSYEAEHSGSLWSFIRACVCLDYLRQTRSLRDYLWDEFIRVFSAGYYEYVNTNTNPLPAIEWFNNLEGVPQFDSMVVKKGNIDTVLSLYKDTVEEAKGYIKPTSSNEDTDARPTYPASSSSSGTTPIGHPKAARTEKAKEKRPSTETTVPTESRSKRLRTESLGNRVPSSSFPRPPSSAVIPSNNSTPDLHMKQKSVRSSSASLTRTNNWKYGGSLKKTARDPERQERLRQFMSKRLQGPGSSLRGAS